MTPRQYARIVDRARMQGRTRSGRRSRAGSAGGGSQG